MAKFTASDLATEAGVRMYGADYVKALSPIDSPAGCHGWGSLHVREPFSGAWQRNLEERHSTILCYPTLYACLNRISADIGKLPFELKAEDRNGIWILGPSGSPHWPVLRKPNAYQTAQQFRVIWILSKLIQGNTYVLKGRGKNGAVERLWVLDPCRVQPMVADTGDIFYKINYGTASNLLPEGYPGEELIVPASEIIHDLINPFHHQLIGIPPLCAAYWPAVKNLKILRDSTRFFSNGANPGGILSAPAGMSETDANAVKEYWNTNFQGENAGKVAVIGADMKFTPFAFKAADSQLVEQMRYSDEQICQPFGIPPFKIGIGSIPAGMKVDDMNQLYYGDALQPHIEAMEALLDEGLGVTRPQGVELDLEPLLRMDVGKQADVHTKLTGGGIETPNEGRRAFNLAPLEGGDTVYMQQQDFPLDQVRQNKIVPAGPAQPAEPAAEDVADVPQDDEEVRSLKQQVFLMKALSVIRSEVLSNG